MRIEKKNQPNQKVILVCNRISAYLISMSLPLICSMFHMSRYWHSGNNKEQEINKLIQQMKPSYLGKLKQSRKCCQMFKQTGVLDLIGRFISSVGTLLRPHPK